jgi:hypothetical protein
MEAMMTRTQSHWFVPGEGTVLLLNEVGSSDLLRINELAFANRREEIRDVASAAAAHATRRQPRLVGRGRWTSWIVRLLDRLFAVRSV